MKWTIRNVAPQAIEVVAGVSETSSSYFVELVSEAIAHWYALLPYEEDGDLMVFKTSQRASSGGYSPCSTSCPSH